MELCAAQVNKSSLIRNTIKTYPNLKRCVKILQQKVGGRQTVHLRRSAFMKQVMQLNGYCFQKVILTIRGKNYMLGIVEICQAV